MPVKKKAVKKKVTTKKKTTKKAPVKKKVAVKKKTAAKKTAAKKKTGAKKKSATKKTTAKKKATTKKKTVAKKKSTTKKTTAKKKAATKKQPVAKKTAAKKAPVKKSITKKTVSKKKVETKKATIKREKNVTTKKTTISTSKPEPVVRANQRQSPIDNIPYIDTHTHQESEDYMNAAQKQHFRNILNEWKCGLMQEVDRTVGHMKDEAANFPDPADRATQEEEFSLELRTRDRERKLIKKIDEALQRIEDDEYGYCEACGIEIGSKRLEARPTATLCIDCKTVDEIREKQLLA